MDAFTDIGWFLYISLDSYNVWMHLQIFYQWCTLPWTFSNIKPCTLKLIITNTKVKDCFMPKVRLLRVEWSTVQTSHSHILLWRWVHTNHFSINVLDIVLCSELHKQWNIRTGKSAATSISKVSQWMSLNVRSLWNVLTTFSVLSPFFWRHNSLCIIIHMTYDPAIKSDNMPRGREVGVWLIPKLTREINYPVWTCLKYIIKIWNHWMLKGDAFIL